MSRLRVQALPSHLHAPGLGWSHHATARVSVLWKVVNNTGEGLVRQLTSPEHAVKGRLVW